VTREENDFHLTSELHESVRKMPIEVNGVDLLVLYCGQNCGSKRDVITHVRTADT